jgi:hypothetical protein
MSIASFPDGTDVLLGGKGSRLVVAKATYGSNRNLLANLDVTYKIRSLAREGLLYAAGGIHTLIGDPEPGRPKVFWLKYTCAEPAEMAEQAVIHFAEQTGVSSRDTAAWYIQAAMERGALPFDAASLYHTRGCTIGPELTALTDVQLCLTNSDKQNLLCRRDGYVTGELNLTTDSILVLRRKHAPIKLPLSLGVRETREGIGFGDCVEKNALRTRAHDHSATQNVDSSLEEGDLMHEDQRVSKRMTVHRVSCEIILPQCTIMTENCAVVLNNLIVVANELKMPIAGAADLDRVVAVREMLDDATLLSVSLALRSSYFGFNDTNSTQRHSKSSAATQTEFISDCHLEVSLAQIKAARAPSAGASAAGTSEKRAVLTRASLQLFYEAMQPDEVDKVDHILAMIRAGKWNVESVVRGLSAKYAAAPALEYVSVGDDDPARQIGFRLLRAVYGNDRGSCDCTAVLSSMVVPVARRVKDDDFMGGYRLLEIPGGKGKYDQIFGQPSAGSKELHLQYALGTDAQGRPRVYEASTFEDAPLVISSPPADHTLDQQKEQHRRQQRLADFSALSIKELVAYMAQHSISSAECIEKQDMLRKIMSVFGQTGSNSSSYSSRKATGVAVKIDVLPIAPMRIRLNSCALSALNEFLDTLSSWPTSQRNSSNDGSGSGGNASSKSGSAEKWSCAACTLANPSQSIRCEMCGGSRGADEASCAHSQMNASASWYEESAWELWAKGPSVQLSVHIPSMQVTLSPPHKQVSVHAQQQYPHGHLLLLHFDHVQLLFEHHGSADGGVVIPGADGSAKGQDFSISMGSIKVEDMLPGLQDKLVLGTPRAKGTITPWIQVVDWPKVIDSIGEDGVLPAGLQPDLKLHAHRVPDFSIEHHLSSVTLCINHPLHVHAGKELVAHAVDWYTKFVAMLEVHSKQLLQRHNRNAATKAKHASPEDEEVAAVGARPLVAIDRFRSTCIEAKVWWNSRNSNDASIYRSSVMKGAEEALLGKLGNAIVSGTKLSGKVVKVMELKQMLRIGDRVLVGTSGHVMSLCIDSLNAHFTHAAHTAVAKYLPALMLNFSDLSVS